MKVAKTVLYCLLALMCLPTIIGSYFTIIFIAKAIEIWKPEAVAKWWNESPVMTGKFAVKVTNEPKAP
jgi:hypothetical protein